MEMAPLGSKGGAGAVRSRPLALRLHQGRAPTPATWCCSQLYSLSRLPQTAGQVPVSGPGAGRASLSRNRGRDHRGNSRIAAAHVDEGEGEDEDEDDTEDARAAAWLGTQWEVRARPAARTVADDGTCAVVQPAVRGALEPAQQTVLGDHDWSGEQARPVLRMAGTRCSPAGSS